MKYTKGRHKGVRTALALLVAGMIMSLSPVGADVAQASEESPEAAETDVLGVPQQQDDEDRDPEANLPYLFAVFIITWAVFFGYIFVTSRRQKDLRREIEALKETLAEGERQTAEGERSPGSREP